MQKKIFRVITILIAVSLAVFSLVIGKICYDFYCDTAENELKSVADVLVETNKDNPVPSIINQQLHNSLKYNVRLTLIDLQGNVTYDNTADYTQMENHADREEFKQAVKNGSGETARLSETIGKSEFYYAVKLDDSVIRFSRERSSLGAIFVSVIPIILSVAAIIFIVATIISIKLSESIIAPINKLVSQFDIENEGFENITNSYEELDPIIKNADVLFKRISKNVEKLKREKQKITLITDNMVEGMILLDSDYTVLSVNHSATKILNPYFDPKSHGKLSHLTTNNQLFELLAVLDEENSARGVIKIRNSYFRTYINKSAFNGDYGIIILLADVTETIKSEEIRREFSANVSHELKTPLTTIKGFGEMMDNGIITSSQDIKKYGGTIYREAERLLYLINDIIRLSEIEERASSDTDEIEITKTAHDVEEILQNKAYNHKVTINIDGDSFKFMGNQSYITELLLNLMDNAIKYNNDGGSVWVGISRDDKCAIISVRDNGIGIDKKDKERVFERFYRVDKSRSKQTGGTGLGLSIVKHIVAYHNGELKIDSALNRGTHIRIFLPFDHGDDE